MLVANIFSLPENILLRVSPVVLSEELRLVSMGRPHPCDKRGIPQEYAPTLLPLRTAAKYLFQIKQCTDDTHGSGT